MKVGSTAKLRHLVIGVYHFDLVLFSPLLSSDSLAMIFKLVEILLYSATTISWFFQPLSLSNTTLASSFFSLVKSQTGDSGQKNKNMNVKTGQIAQTPSAYLHENAAPIKMINN